MYILFFDASETVIWFFDDYSTIEFEAKYCSIKGESNKILAIKIC